MLQACSVSGCLRKYYARGLCNMHIQRLRKHGTTHGGPTTHASPAIRFWRYVNKISPEECWLWTGKTEKTGYGRFQAGGRGSPQGGAHRYSHFLATGENPPVVMHACDNRPCVNPAHLISGTYRANMEDMVAKGRSAHRGPTWDRHHSTKLNPDKVREIRLRQADSAGSVGREYGVNHGVIISIWRGRTWRHVT